MDCCDYCGRESETLTTSVVDERQFCGKDCADMYRATEAAICALEERVADLTERVVDLHEDDLNDTIDYYEDALHTLKVKIA